MNLVAGGDIRKASILFDRYYTNVYSYLLRLNKDKMLAEDLTQNVFEKMIKYKASYDGKKCFKAWLFTIVRNTNIDHHRKRKYDSLDDSFMEVESEERNAQRQLEAKEGKEKLMMALDRLPTEEREILIMAKFEKMKYSQISKVMGMTESTLKVKAHRSIKKLRTILVNDLSYEY